MSFFLSIIFCSIIAGLIYAGIVYVTIPYKLVNLSSSFIYLTGGIIAVLGVLGVHEYLPWWTDLAKTLTVMLFDMDGMFGIFYYQFKFFLQIGFLEEFMKLITFLMLTKTMPNTTKHPVAIMYYMMMVSLGFGLVENAYYAITNLSTNPLQILFFRSTSSTLGHMVFGLIMGFWIGLGKLPIVKYGRSLADLFMKQYPKIKQWVYTGIGLLGATILHGIFNFNVEMLKEGSVGVSYILLVIGLIAGAWCFKYLNEEYRKTKKNYTD